jgi:hypothetical protein
MVTWIYKKTEPRLWTVGYYTPNGEWYPTADYGTEKEAVEQVHYLNGGDCDKNK